MKIDSSGNVSIGTTSTTAPLRVKVATDANFAVQNTSSTVQLQGINDAANAFTTIDIAGNPIKFSANGSESMRIDSSGNVGIKNTSPTSLLHLGSNATDSAIDIGFQNSSRHYTVKTESGNFILKDESAAAERWRIDSSGRMTNGFDGSSYSSFLQVAGNSISGGVVNFIDPDVSVATSNHILRCTFSVDTDSQGKFIAFYDGGGNIGSVSQNGASSVLFNTTSDERLKENIVDASSQLDVIKNVKVREFDWKSSSKHDIGMIAQELKDVIPNVVIEGGDDVTEEPFGVDYGKLTPYLIKAIQEQQTIIEDLKSRIETLEG
jgi:hypothetical protein